MCPIYTQLRPVSNSETMKYSVSSMNSCAVKCVVFPKQTKPYLLMIMQSDTVSRHTEQTSQTNVTQLSVISLHACVPGFIIHVLCQLCCPGP